MLDQKKSLKEYGVKDGDMVMMEQIRRPGGGAGGGPGGRPQLGLQPDPDT